MAITVVAANGCRLGYLAQDAFDENSAGSSSSAGGSAPDSSLGGAFTGPGSDGGLSGQASEDALGGAAGVGSMLGGGGAPTGGAPAGNAGSAASPNSGGTGGAGLAGNGGASANAGTVVDGGAAGDPVTGGNAGTGGSGGSGPPCTAGLALAFSDGVFVELPRLIQDDFTIEAWIKGGTSATGSVFWQGTPFLWADVQANLSYDFGASFLNDRLVMSVGFPDVEVSSTSVVMTNVWVHVAVTRTKSSGLLRVLVNGALEASVTAGTRTLDAVPIITLGTNPGRDRYYDGLMDEVRLWDTARTAAEIQTTMNGTLLGNEPGLVGYYRFDETSGSTITDSSSRMNDGQLTGAGAGARLPSTAPLSCTP